MTIISCTDAPKCPPQLHVFSELNSCPFSQHPLLHPDPISSLRLTALLSTGSLQLELPYLLLPGILSVLFGGCTYWIIKLSLPATSAYHQLHFLCLLQCDLWTATWSFLLPPLWPLHNVLVLTTLLFVPTGRPGTRLINWISGKASAIIQWVRTGAVFLIRFSNPLAKGNTIRVSGFIYLFRK